MVNTDGMTAQQQRHFYGFKHGAQVAGLYAAIGIKHHGARFKFVDGKGEVF